MLGEIKKVHLKFDKKLLSYYFENLELNKSEINHKDTAIYSINYIIIDNKITSEMMILQSSTVLCFT